MGRPYPPNCRVPSLARNSSWQHVTFNISGFGLRWYKHPVKVNFTFQVEYRVLHALCLRKLFGTKEYSLNPNEIIKDMKSDSCCSVRKMESRCKLGTFCVSERTASASLLENWGKLVILLDLQILIVGSVMQLKYSDYSSCSFTWKRGFGSWPECYKNKNVWVISKVSSYVSNWEKV
jgi:hypothetical protein